MFQLEVNKRLCFIKANYFLTLGTASPIIGFLPTIARQLGYSITTYGTVMMCISIVSVILCPLIGIVGERIHKKKLLFFVVILLMGLSGFAFVFVPKVPLETIIKLQCDTENILIVTSKSDSLKSLDQTVFVDDDVGETIFCKLHCQDSTVYYVDTVHRLYNQTDLQSSNQTTSMKYDKSHHSDIEITFKPNDIKNKNGSININVSSIRLQDSVQTVPTICHRNSNTFCNVMNCSNETVKNLVVTKSYTRNLFNLYQFWVFIFVTIFYSSFATMAFTLQNPICLDLLGDKLEDFGKQKCWGSIGWGTFSIFIGWLVDRFSINQTDKNYSPVFYSTIILTFLNVIVVSKMKVVETKKTHGKSTKLNNYYRLFASHNIISLFVWSMFNSFFHAIITHFLFWYMEDLVSENNVPDQRAYIKTLQGLAQGIQCFGGEIPFYFWSGWIIKTMGGHVNCMALVLGAMAVRMYLYTVIWNPAWIIAIELLNGVSYALGFAVKMSFAKIISPPGTTFTVLGFLALCEMIGEGIASLLGGYLFGLYGGVWSFRFFAYSSGVMCLVSVLNKKFGWIKYTNNHNFINVSTKSINNDENIYVEK